MPVSIVAIKDRIDRLRILSLFPSRLNSRSYLEVEQGQSLARNVLEQEYIFHQGMIRSQAQCPLTRRDPR